MNAPTHREETRGLPSASSFPRYAACPGSFLAEGNEPEEETFDARSGTRVHARLAAETAPDPVDPDDPETIDIVMTCRGIEVELLRKWTEDRNGRIIRERRLWLHDLQTLSPLFSGKPDGVWTDLDRAVVWDFKTGRGVVPTAEVNWQMRALAVLVAENYAVNEVIVAIIQPWASPQVTQAAYGISDLSESRRVCIDLARRIVQPGQPRNASPDACRYCRAKAVCPEAMAVVNNMAVIALAEAEPGEIDGPMMAKLLDSCGHAERVVGAIRAKAKRMLCENALAIPGWFLKRTKPRESIEDTAKVWERAIARGVPSRDFVAGCDMTKKALSNLLRIATGMRGAALDAEFDKLIEGCVKLGSPNITVERLPANTSVEAAAGAKAAVENSA